MSKIASIIFVAAVCASIVRAGSVYVNGGQTTGANNGTSWENAYRAAGSEDVTGGLQSALADANANNGTVYVARWVPDPTNPKIGYRPATLAGFSLNSNNNVTLTGGYNPDGSGVYNVDLFETIISGDINGNDADIDVNSDPCGLYIAAATSPTPGLRSDNAQLLSISNKTVTVTGLTLRDGKAGEGAVANIGTTGNVTFDNCFITQNISTSGVYGGGCFRASGGTLKVFNSEFLNNCAYAQGSFALCDISGPLSLTVVVQNCLIKSMATIDSGGTFTFRDDSQSSSTTVTITDCIFTQCQMGANTGNGSGIILYRVKGLNNNVTITNCLFKDLNCYPHGAAFYNSCSAPQRLASGTQTTTGTVMNCLAIGCTPNGSTNGVVTGNVFFSEISDVNGTGYLQNSNITLHVINCTITGNTPDGQGAVGAYAFASSTQLTNTIHLKNSIVWGNTRLPTYKPMAQLFINSTDVGSSRCSMTANYCCLDTTDPNDYGYNRLIGSGNIFTDPQLNSAGFLSSTSPCKDTGNNSYNPEPYDLAGRPRKNGTIDIGVYEYYRPGDIDGSGKVDLIDFEKLSSYWLAPDCSVENKWCYNADLNYSGGVNLADYSLMATYWLLP